MFDFDRCGVVTVGVWFVLVLGFITGFVLWGFRFANAFLLLSFLIGLVFYYCVCRWLVCDLIGEFVGYDPLVGLRF